MVNTKPLSHTKSALDWEFYLRRWLPIGAGMVLAAYVGWWVGNSNWTPLLRLLALSIVLFVAFSLQEKGWVLIPMFWMATGSVRALPVPFAWRDVAILLALSAYVAHHSMVKVPRVSMRHVLWIVLMVNLVWLAAMWVRKPAGFRVFGGETMGARFYINIFMAAVGAWVLLRMPQSAHKLTRIPYYLLGGTLVGAIANTLTFFVPASLGLVMSLYQSGGAYTDMGVVGRQVVRFTPFRDAGLIATLLIVTHCDPVKFFHPGKRYLYLLLVSLAGVAVSGFRTVIAMCFIYIGLSIILWRDWRKLALFSTIGLLLLAGLVVGQGRVYSLPLTVQRSLCFLPGNWSPVVEEDARGSSEGRFKWWRDILKYRLIENWWVGDGIGVSAAEAATVAESSRRNLAVSAEFLGAYHNGPLTTIRCVGIIGLTMLSTLMICNIVYALRCLRQCRGTTLEALAMFIAIPIIWFPIGFTLIFGSFEGDMPEIIFQTGLLLLLIRMLKEHPELLTAEPVSA